MTSFARFPGARNKTSVRTHHPDALRSCFWLVLLGSLVYFYIVESVLFSETNGELNLFRLYSQTQSFSFARFTGLLLHVDYKMIAFR